MERIAQFWDAVPQGAQWALAGLGALLVAKKALGFLQMVLNIFVLSGTNVSPEPPVSRLLPLIVLTSHRTAPQVWRQGDMGGRHRRIRRDWKGVCDTNCL